MADCVIIERNLIAIVAPCPGICILTPSINNLFLILPKSLKETWPFWLLIVALIFLLWVPHLLCMGMFVDGVFDAVTAENLYKGHSTFWAPQDIEYAHPEAWGSPPLAMYFLSLCYKLFGDYYIVERIYSLGCAILQVSLTAVLWNVLFSNNEEAKRYAWLPCLLWLSSPLISWSYSNNLLENTMSLFTTAGVVITVRYVVTQRYLILSAGSVAILLLLGVITKGPVAFFPLAAPVLMIGYRYGFGAGRAFIFCLLQIAILAAGCTLLFSFAQPANFLHHYFDAQLRNGLMQSGTETLGSAHILLELLLATIVFTVLVLLRFFMRNILTKNNACNHQVAIRMLLLGLCGSIPIMISVKQRSFYLLPAMVPLAIACAACVLPLAKWVQGLILQYKFTKIMNLLSSGTIIISIVLCLVNRGTVIRDQDMLSDMQSVNPLLKTEPVIRADWSFYSEWSMRAYWLRLFDKKLCMPDEQAPAHFYVTRPDMRGNKLPGNATKVFAGKTFDLYRI